MFILFLFLYIVFLFTQSLTKPLLLQVMQSFITIIFPTLFISFILIDLMKNTKLIKKISLKLFPLFHKLFNLKYPSSVQIILLSFLAGTPGNARMIHSAYNEKNLDLEEANLLLSITSTMSFSYIITILGLTYSSHFVPILLSYYLGHFLFFFLQTRFYNPNGYKYKEFNMVDSIDSTTVFLNSINTNMKTLLNILGVMLFCTAMYAILQTIAKDANLFSFIFEINLGIMLMPHNPYLFLSAITFLGISLYAQIKHSFPEANIIKLIKNKIIILVMTNLFFLIFKDLMNPVFYFKMDYIFLISLAVILIFTILKYRKQS